MFIGRVRVVFFVLESRAPYFPGLRSLARQSISWTPISRFLLRLVLHEPVERSA